MKTKVRLILRDYSEGDIPDFKIIGWYVANEVGSHSLDDREILIGVEIEIDDLTFSASKPPCPKLIPFEIIRSHSSGYLRTDTGGDGDE